MSDLTASAPHEYISGENIRFEYAGTVEVELNSMDDYPISRVIKQDANGDVIVQGIDPTPIDEAYANGKTRAPYQQPILQHQQQPISHQQHYGHSHLHDHAHCNHGSHKHNNSHAHFHSHGDSIGKQSDIIRDQINRTINSTMMCDVEFTDDLDEMKQFWEELPLDKKKKICTIESNEVLKVIQEDPKTGCSCRVCSSKKLTLEKELQKLYVGYYSVRKLASNALDETELNISLVNSIFGLPVVSDNEKNEKEKVNEKEEEEEKKDFSSVDAMDSIMSVADDLVKNNGENFINLVEQLNNAKRNNNVDVSSNSAENMLDVNKLRNWFQSPDGTPFHKFRAQNTDNEVPTQKIEELNLGVNEEQVEEEQFELAYGEQEEEIDDAEVEDGEEDDDFDDESYDSNYENESDNVTRKRLEETYQMLQFITSRVLRIKIHEAFKAKKADDISQSLLDEFAKEEAMLKEKEERQKQKKEKEREKKRLQKIAKEEERKRKEEEERLIKLKEEEERQKKMEETRKLKEAEKKKRDEEKKRKEEEKKKRKKEAQLEKQRREKEEKERKKKEKQEQQAKLKQEKKNNGRSKETSDDAKEPLITPPNIFPEQPLQSNMLPQPPLGDVTMMGIPPHAPPIMMQPPVAPFGTLPPLSNNGLFPDQMSNMLNSLINGLPNPQQQTPLNQPTVGNGFPFLPQQNQQQQQQQPNWSLYSASTPATAAGPIVPQQQQQQRQLSSQGIAPATFTSGSLIGSVPSSMGNASSVVSGAAASSAYFNDLFNPLAPQQPVVQTRPQASSLDPLFNTNTNSPNVTATVSSNGGPVGDIWNSRSMSNPTIGLDLHSPLKDLAHTAAVSNAGSIWSSGGAAYPSSSSLPLFVVDMIQREAHASSFKIPALGNSDGRSFQLDTMFQWVKPIVDQMHPGLTLPQFIQGLTTPAESRNMVSFQVQDRTVTITRHTQPQTQQISSGFASLSLDSGGSKWGS